MLEHRGTIDFILEQFLPKGLAKLDAPVREILRAAVAQARYMQVPVSAAVNEAVKLTRSFKKSSASGLVNAVLRKACVYDLDKAVFKDEIEKLMVLGSASREVAEFLHRHYPKEALGILTHTADGGMTSLRANPLKASAAQLCELLMQNGAKSAEPGIVPGSVLARFEGSPAEQEGEEHHGGDVHKALEGEKGSHFPAAAAQILDNLIGKTHENIVAGVEKNHPGQQGEEPGIAPPKGLGRRWRGRWGWGCLLGWGTGPEGKGGRQQQEGRPAQQHRDTLWTESGGCAAAEGGGQRVGPCPHAPGKAEVQRHALVDTVHPQGIEQGGQELKQDQQGEKESPLDGLSRKQEQTAGAQQHGQDQQGGELPQGENL